MSVRLNGSTSGYTELDAGAVAGNNTIKMPTSNGSAYQIIRNGATAGTTEFADKIVSGTAQNSTSGTSIDFTGIPSWVKRVTVTFSGVSTNGTSLVLVRLGTSAGIEATGYSGGVGAMLGTNCNAQTMQSTGFDTVYTAASVSVTGAMIITNVAGNTWIESHNLAYIGGSYLVGLGAGTKTLSGTLDRVRITTVSGTDTFDAGTINILYE